MNGVTKKKPSRRFIAGASCPSCAKIDTTYIDLRHKLEFRVCIRCEFEERRMESVSPKPLRFQPD
ncbi:MAG: YheV family putative metal-binding protein [Pseudomonadales bacterium]|nr:YheV family putative metal-binding protein [Pseudomonadales bacterium]